MNRGGMVQEYNKAVWSGSVRDEAADLVACTLAQHMLSLPEKPHAGHLAVWLSFSLQSLAFQSETSESGHVVWPRGKTVRANTLEEKRPP
eukprot:5346596-Amphidinium_carterae.1